MKGKPERFKQVSPKDQMQVALMALEGHICNCHDGVINPRELQEKSQQVIVDLRCLNSYLPNSWDEQKEKQND